MVDDIVDIRDSNTDDETYYIKNETVVAHVTPSMETNIYFKGGFSYSVITDEGDWEWYRAFKNSSGDMNTTKLFNMTLEENGDNFNEI